jgi:hypothetical protein
VPAVVGRFTTILLGWAVISSTPPRNAPTQPGPP